VKITASFDSLRDERLAANRKVGETEPDARLVALRATNPASDKQSDVAPVATA
jgi:hypothetical protein